MTMYKMLHKYYEDCFTNGEFDREKILSKGLIDSNYGTNYRLSLLEKIYKMVLSAKFHNNMSLNYLKNSNRTFDDIVMAHNKESGENLNIKTGRSRIIYCSRKVNEVFEELEYEKDTICVIDWLFNTKLHMGMESSAKKIDLRNEFITQINKFNDMYVDTPSIGKKDLVISLPSYSKVKEISEEEYDNFMEIIRPYSRNYIAQIQSVVNQMTNEVGYLRYIMSASSGLTDLDKERRNDVLRWLGRPEIIEEELIKKEDSIDNDEEDEYSEDGVEF